MTDTGMHEKPDAGQLLLSQIGLFNEAAVFYYRTVDPAVKQGLDRCVDAFVADRGWLGSAGFAETESCWLAPRHWSFAEDSTERPSDSDVGVWFEIHSVKSVDDYWLALFCGQGVEGGQAGFRFSVRPKGRFSGKAWDAYMRNLDSMQLAGLSEYGFQNLGKEGFFLPVRLDPSRLASSWRAGDGVFTAEDDSFVPLRQALEALDAALPLFDNILNGFLQTQGGVPSPLA